MLEFSWTPGNKLKKKKCFWVGRKYMPAAFMGCIKGLYPLESKQITPEEEF